MAKLKPSKTFKELKQLWYAKLKAKGFNDAERDEYRLRVSSVVFKRKTGRSESSLTAVAQAAKREYYIMAEHFLNSHLFESRLEENIWAYHTEGLSYRNITKILNKVRKKKLQRTKVWTMINKLETLMKRLNRVIT